MNKVATYDLLSNIAHRVANGETVTIAPDWGLGSGTLIFPDGSHTHFGADIEDDPKKAVDDFIQGLHALLVNGTGLSIHVPETHTENPKNCTCPRCASVLERTAGRQRAIPQVRFDSGRVTFQENPVSRHLISLKIDRILDALSRCDAPIPRGIVLTNDEFQRFKAETAGWLCFTASGNITKYRDVVIQAEIPTYPPIN